MADIFSLPEVAAHIPRETGPVLKSVPASARANVYGYRSESEALELKFHQAAGETIDYFSIKYTNGHCKGMMRQTILALVVHMATWLHGDSLVLFQGFSSQNNVCSPKLRVYPQKTSPRMKTFQSCLHL